MDSSQLHSISSSEAMGEAYEGGSGRSSKEIEDLPLQISKYPRNLLQIFSTNNPKQPHETERVKQQEEEEDVELNLGLSLGGKFGVDKSHCRLIRSSSVAGTTPLIREEHMETETPPAALVRTASLPSETEEEWRKRKEMQTLRRMEAKRRRSEKQMNVRESGEERGGGAGKGTEGLLNLNLRGKLEKEERYVGMGNKSSSSAGTPFGLSNWAIAAAKQGGLGGEIDAAVKGKGGIFGSLQGFLGQQSSQGSGESQGGSSCASELQNKALQGCGEARSHTSFHLLPESCGEEGIGSSGSKSETRCRVYSSEMESSSNQPAIAETSRKRKTGTSSMEDMPCVFTIGDGPGGRKVDGILYKYGKGEEVRIMCICHARFFTPKDFVKHAGGRDVEHPLRHIVVNPSLSPFR